MLTTQNPEPKKTMLIVDKEFDSEAHEKFDHLGVRVIRAGPTIVFRVVLLETWKQSISLFEAK